VSGTVGGIDLSVLYGFASSGGVSGGNPILALTQAERNQTKDIAAQAKTPEVQRDVATFRKAVASSKDVKTLLSNPTVQKVLLTANGLGDQIGSTGLVVKALMSNPSDPKSLANQLSNKAWKSTAATYNFASKGLAVIKDPKVLDTVANAYAEVSWRKSLDVTTPGLSDALTFRTTVANAKNVDDILGDPVLRRVVTTTLGIPQEIANQTLGAQENAITSRVDIKQFKNKNFVETFVKRYLVQTSMNASQSSSSSSAGLAAYGLVV
jgi:hypothetical protein